MKHASHSILWRRLDHPGHESALLSFKDSSWYLKGTTVFLHDKFPCRLDYQIVCDSQWHTRSAMVGGWVANGLIDVKIMVGPDLRWFLNDEEFPEVAGCFDLDLNFSPSTNLLPIRRLALPVGAEQEVRAAWLRFPTFKLEPLAQLYRRTHQNTYGYESGGGKFVRDLSVDDEGFVTKYTGFWEIEAGGL